MARPGPRKYSYMKNAMHRTMPTMRETMTGTELQEYCVPPHCIARITQPTPKMNMIRPGQSMMARPEI
jgi:hypothetical protein